VTGKLAGRAALVTGSSRRIGRAIAEALAAEGAMVMIHGRQARDEAEAVASGIRAKGGIAAVAIADVSVPEEARRLVAETLAAFGRLDILVNNAAVRRRAPIAGMDYAEWRDVVSIILDGAFLCTTAALVALKASGHGRVINIGGASAFTGARDHAHVIAAKAGLGGLTRALAYDLGADGVTVNMVSPGLIETPDDDAKRAGERRVRFSPESIPVGHTGIPGDVARAVLALAGDDFTYMTGQTVHVNGGIFMS
jgi:3-oxoacyl-[acyl-carrier protein] reductase